jgi:putative endonuclease
VPHLPTNEVTYYVYIMASRSRALYVGKDKRPAEARIRHKSRLVDGFTPRYHVTRLVYYEETGHMIAAIERERQLTGWIRARKLALIEDANPTWSDLCEEWMGQPHPLLDPERSEGSQCNLASS